MVPMILYVEDNDDIREITSYLLAKDGYNVTPAANGLEALNLFQQQDFDLIITNISMPLMDGNRLIEKLAEESGVPPVIVLTYNVNEVNPSSLITLIATKPLTSDFRRYIILNALERGMSHWGQSRVA